MFRKQIALLLILLILVSCQTRKPTPVQPTLPVDQPPATQPIQTQPASATATANAGEPLPEPNAPSPTPNATLQAISSDAQPIRFDSRAGQAFTGTPLSSYKPGQYPQGLDALPIDLSTLGNPGVIAGLTSDQHEALSANGFVVIQTGDKQFRDIRNSVSKRYGQPYYLTTDAAYHALHVTFDELLEGLERERMGPVMVKLLQALYGSTSEYAQASQGTSLETDVLLAKQYLAVAILLFDPTAEIDAATERAVTPQIEQIMGYGGKERSVLIPNFTDDYGAYRPVGHYAGRPELENYFRGMTWLGRVNFFFQDPDQPELVPSRVPLIITHALSNTDVDGKLAAQVWAELNEIIDFMVGPSDDPGPVELATLMEQVYGPNPGLDSIADEAKWQAFLARTNELPAPAINSTFAKFTSSLGQQRSWRLMGQRFTLDSFIFQSLIYTEVGTQEKPRKLPSGLDVAAAFGSQQAMEALELAGETQYVRYPQQMARVQEMVHAQPEAQWLNRFYTSWLYAFLPQVEPKEASFPPYMRTEAWGYKEVNSMLGSWAELKHDTVLYFKMPIGAGGGGPPVSGPAPAYVEPNPNVFYRLAYAARELYEGINKRTSDWRDRGWTGEPEWGLDVDSYLQHLSMLASRFERFGEIAEEELQGKPPSVDDYGMLQECLEYKECKDNMPDSTNGPKPDPIPVVAAVAGADESVLEVAVGELNRIYVAIPIEGKLQIAQGGVFSYYEFTQPISDRLTDEAWREKLANSPPPAPQWVQQFILSGGEPRDALAFRVGDIYYLTEAGYNPPLNLRAGPGKSEPVLRKLDQEEYLEIIDGPVVNSAGTWWKVEVIPLFGGETADVGWVLENQEWYERSAPQ